MSELTPYMGKLMPYAKRAGPFLKYGPYGKAAQAAAFAYRNRNAFKSVAKGAAEAARAARLARQKMKRAAVIKAKRENFSPENIGKDIGTSNAQRTTILDNRVQQSTRSLYFFDLTAIPRDTPTDIDNRIRNIVNVSGFKICMEVANLRDKPLHLNVAVLGLKDSVDDVTTTDFFRGTGVSRGTNFSTALSSNDFSCRPINCDKYVVLKHERLLLGGSNAITGYVDRMGRTFTSLQFYVPLKRQVQFDNNNSSVPTSGNVYLVYWADEFDTDEGGAVQTLAYNVRQRFITYFRETHELM